MAKAKARCLIIGNHPIMLDGLCRVLRPEFEAIAVAASVSTALAAAAAFRPDAAIIDLETSCDALGIGRRLCEAHPGLAVTYITAAETPPCGVNTFSKTRPASELMQFIRRGRVDPGVVPASTPTQAAILSDRERQVLILLMRGLSMKEVARVLGITARTVAFHKYKLMDTNGLNNRVELLEFALREGILPVADYDRDQPPHTSTN